MQTTATPRKTRRIERLLILIIIILSLSAIIQSCKQGLSNDDLGGTYQLGLNSEVPSSF